MGPEDYKLPRCHSVVKLTQGAWIWWAGPRPRGALRSLHSMLMKLLQAFISCDFCGVGAS